MGKKLRRVAGIAAPLAGTLLFPGIGTALGSALGAGAAFAPIVGGAALGAGGGALSGGGVRGAITGGLTGGAAGGGGSMLGSALGASGARASALGNAILGAGAGGVSGGAQGAGLGAALGGLGGYYSAGGFDGLGGQLSDALSGTALGTKAGSVMAGGVGPTEGSGLLGGLTRAGSVLPSTVSGSGAAGGSSYDSGRVISSTLGAGIDYMANKDAEKQMLRGQREALARLEPYTDMKFEPGDLTQDPGYQFRLQEGQRSLDRSLGARGMMFSGEALRAGQEFGQGLADQTYNDAYNRWLQQNAQNIGTAQAAGGIQAGMGATRGQARIGRGNVLSQGLAGALGSRLMFDPTTQQYVYA